MKTFVIRDTVENARAFMQKRGLHLATIVVDPIKMRALEVTEQDQVAYVGEYWLNPGLAEIQHRIPDNIRVLDIAEDEKGVLTDIVGVTRRAAE